MGFRTWPWIIPLIAAALLGTASAARAFCSLTCPSDIRAVGTGVGIKFVNYPAPTTGGTCGAVTCSPPSGASYQFGATTIACSSLSTAAQCTFTVTVGRCLQDDESGDQLVLFPDATPRYQLTTCGDLVCPPCGQPLGSEVEVTLNKGKLKLTDDQPGHKLRAVFDDGRNRGSASVIYKEGKNRLSFKLKDSSLADNTCSCP